MHLDFIGDIHGHAPKLEALLLNLGYTDQDGCFRHPVRTVVFVGDYIDRGPAIRRTLQIVKTMCDQGEAVALMGNHEYNCLCYHTPDGKGGYLRKHNDRNNVQHGATVDQFADYPEEWAMYFAWMHDLPLWYESDEVRAVHACWHAGSMATLHTQLNHGRLTAATLLESAAESTALYAAIEITLKGKELALPSGITIPDAEGYHRDMVRIRWWMQPIDTTYGKLMVHPEHSVAEILVDPGHEILADTYPADAVPVFFGHYWLEGEPLIYEHNVCCLDYSVARGGKLVGYRYHGEQDLEIGKLVW